VIYFVWRVCRKWSRWAGSTLNPMSFLSFLRKTSQHTPRSWRTTRPGTARKLSSLHAGKYCPNSLGQTSCEPLRRTRMQYCSISLKMAQQSNLLSGHLPLAATLIMTPCHAQTPHFELSVDISTKQTLSAPEGIRLLDVSLCNKIVRDHL